MTAPLPAGRQPAGQAATGQALLQVSDLSVRVGGGAGTVAALSGVNLSVAPGEVVGLVGESGGGKTMLARSIIRALPETARTEGAVLLDGTDVFGMTPAQLRRHRGHGAAMCFQNPRSALSPVRTVGRQLADRIEVHQRVRGAAARREAVRLLSQVGIRDPQRRLRAYPHEISGGMAQRVMIALALACAPRLLLADEPTTGLDATLVREILGLFRSAADDGLGVLLISHDLASVATIADRVAVLYAGTVVETGPAGQLLSEPAHPYTRALLRSVPDLDGVPVRATRGAMPLLREPPGSCPFAPRCESADDACRAARPPLTTRADGSQVACFHPVGGLAVPAGPVQAATIPEGTVPADPLPEGTVPAETVPSDTVPPDTVPPGTPRGTAVPATAGQAEATAAAADAPAGKAPAAAGQQPPEAPVLEVRSADVVYRERFGSRGHRALRDVSLSVAHGESVGIVGESGCGKTTLARVIAGLQPLAGGSVRIDGTDLTAMSRGARRQMYRRVQMVFQDPHGALSPRRSVLDAVTEPLRTQQLSKDEMRARAERALAQTGLDDSVLGRRPSQLSGGQAQRVGIARALVVDPELVVLDEPTSALDVTVQAQMLELIKGLAEQRVRSFVFISHDLATVRGFCDRVIVLYLGRVVEEGPTEQVFSAPLHPYTRALLASVPRLRGDAGRSGSRLSRDIDQAEATSGCPLMARCPHAVGACAQPQELREYAPGQLAACHRIPEIAEMTRQPARQPLGSTRQ